MRLELGDCLEVLKNITDNTFDSCITDSPYGISFNNHKWDYDVPSVELWKEVYRVLKPGGYVVNFSSPRTYHRMVINVEDAGFLIRDQLIWLNSQTMPKGNNLKSSHEPIVLACKGKPNKLNIDICRNDYGKQPTPAHRKKESNQGHIFNFGENNYKPNELGRHPSNIICDDLDKDWKRYFYHPKVRNGNNHPTQKPIPLMRWLIDLTTPINGNVLDCYMGSGSTGVACGNDYDFIGIEKEEEYIKIAEARIKNEIK
jgi:DNA modification methylase